MSEESVLDAALRRDRTAERLRGFGPLGIAAFLIIMAAGPVFEPLGAVLVMLWVRASRTPWPQIGYVRPRSWTATIVGGIAFGVALKLLMKAVVMPLLGADPINHEMANYVATHPGALPALVFDVVVGAGWNEETVFRGFLFERLGKLLGDTTGARTGTVIISAGWFGLVHYPLHGLALTEQALIVGLLVGAIYAIRPRIWLLAVAHAAFDITALALIYEQLEGAVGHWVFR